MIRWIFVLLLVANVVYLGWEIDNETRAKIINYSEPLEVPDGLNRLSLLSELEQLPGRKSAGNNDVEANVPENTGQLAKLIDMEPFSIDTFSDNAPQSSIDTFSENAPQSPVEKEENKGSNAGGSLCFSYGPLLNSDDSDRLTRWFLQRNIYADSRQTEEKGNQFFWVHLAPQESTTVAIGALQDLIRKGVKDLRLISRGDLKNAISLGLFSSQKAVNERIGEIKEKGYQPVLVPHYGENKIHWVDVQVDKKNDKVLADISSGLPARYNSEKVDCTEIGIVAENP